MRCEIEAAQDWDGRVPGTTVTAAKRRRLGDSLSSGSDQLAINLLVVSHLSLGVISERGTLAFQPCHFSGFGFGFGFAPSPLRGEGRDVERDSVGARR